MMDSPHPPDSVSLRFESTKTLRFVIEREATDTSGVDDIAFGVAAGLSWDADEAAFSVRLGILYQAAPNPEALVYGAIETETVFLAVGFSRDELDQDQMELPDEMVAVLLEDAYATTRGVALTLGQGTLLGQFPLPVRRGDQLTRLLRAVQPDPAPGDES